MRIFTTLVGLLLGTYCFASDTLEVTMNKTKLQPGDTLSFNAQYKPWLVAKKTGTLNLWIEDVNHSAMWRFRYPVIDGEAVGYIALPANMPNDAYACYFSLQDDFFSVSGKILSPYKDDAVKITMMVGEKELIAQNISLNAQKEFELKKMLFADRAKIFFSPVKPNRTNDLEVSLNVSLDSLHKHLDNELIMLTVGQPPSPAIINSYVFDPGVFTGETETLKSVEVISKQKTTVQQFEEARVSGIFKTQDAYMFDGTESNQFIGWLNILEWLRGRVAGLIIQPNGDGLNYTAKWQGGETFFFWNEMQVDAQTLATIATTDIAYVKVFRPPFYGAYLGGPGGAIGVYMKDGSQYKNYGPKHNFWVNGYTPETISLPVRMPDNSQSMR
jgi:hypothetical protein